MLLLSIKNFNSTLVSKPEQPSSSVLTGPSSSNVILKPPIEQVHENSFINNSHSWEFLPQFQVTNHDILKPYLFNEVSSSSSSSCSSTATQLNSPQSYTCQESQPPLTPSSSCFWSEFLVNDPVISADFHHLQQQQQHQDSLGCYHRHRFRHRIIYSMASSLVGMVILDRTIME